MNFLPQCSDVSEYQSTTPETIPEMPEQLDAAQFFKQLQPEDPVAHIDRAEIIGNGIKHLASWCLRLLIIAAAAFVIWHILSQVWRGGLPIVLAIIVCTVLWPPVAWLRKHGIPAGLAAMIAILGSFGGFGFLIWLIAPSVVNQSQTLYFQAFEGVQRLQLWLQGPPMNLDPSDLDDRIDTAAQWLQSKAGSIASEVFSGLGIASSVMVTMLVVLVLTFFFLKDGDKFLPWLRGMVGQRAGWHLTELLTRGWITLSGFIRAQALVSLVDAVFIGSGLIILGVPLALALAVLTFITGFIPIVGAFIAGALSVTVALVSLGVTEAVITLIIVLLVQQLEGNILSPLLQSKAVNLHPVVVLISVTVGGSLFNIAGAFLAVPFAAMAAVLFRYLHDMTALRAGEKTAAQIRFATTAGSLSGMQNEAVAKRLLAARQAYIRNDEAAKQAEAEAQAAEDTANNSLEKPTTVSKVQHIGGLAFSTITRIGKAGIAAVKAFYRT